MEHHLLRWSAGSSTPGPPPDHVHRGGDHAQPGAAERDGHQRLVQRAPAVLDTVTARIIGHSRYHEEGHAELADRLPPTLGRLVCPLLVDREAELAALCSAVQRAVAGVGGSVVAARGGGHWETRLVREAADVNAALFPGTAPPVPRMSSDPSVDPSAWLDVPP